jgi:hypothetical protein
VVTLATVAVEVEFAWEVGLEVGGGVVVLFEWGILDVEDVKTGVLVVEE